MIQCVQTLFYWATQAPQKQGKHIIYIPNQMPLRVKENVLNNYRRIAGLNWDYAKQTRMSGYFIPWLTYWCLVSWDPHIQSSVIFLLLTSLLIFHVRDHSSDFIPSFSGPLLPFSKKSQSFKNFSVQSRELKSFFWISPSLTTTPKSLK